MLGAGTDQQQLGPGCRVWWEHPGPRPQLPLPMMLAGAGKQASPGVMGITEFTSVLN